MDVQSYLYVFFRYEKQSNNWKQIPASDFPEALLKVNLSITYDGTYMMNGARQSADDIKRRNNLMHTMDTKIPTSFESWDSKYKNASRRLSGNSSI